jgi:hypothetical protein
MHFFLRFLFGHMSALFFYGPLVRCFALCIFLALIEFAQVCSATV